MRESSNSWCHWAVKPTARIFFIRATLCWHGTSYDPVSVCLSVCLSVTRRGIVSKRLNKTGWFWKSHATSFKLSSSVSDWKTYLPYSACIWVSELYYTGRNKIRVSEQDVKVLTSVENSGLIKLSAQRGDRRKCCQQSTDDHVTSFSQWASRFVYHTTTVMNSVAVLLSLHCLDLLN